MSTKLFKAPHGKIRVALLNGQATTITSEPKSLPECFWAPAYAAGAITGDMVNTSIADKEKQARDEEKAVKNKERQELIDCLQEVFKDPGSFVGKDNKPIARKISARLGRAVTKPEVLEVWDVIVEAE